jgi:hypothetical protein
MVNQTVKQNRNGLLAWIAKRPQNGITDDDEKVSEQEKPGSDVSQASEGQREPARLCRVFHDRKRQGIRVRRMACYGANVAETIRAVVGDAEGAGVIDRLALVAHNARTKTVFYDRRISRGKS